MKIVQASAVIETKLDGDAILKKIEDAGRICYQSKHKITDTSAPEFVRMILKRGHHSVIEHASVSVRFICDRGISHEIVRHRIASYSQESTRYCNYSKEKFGEEITVIDPRPHMDDHDGEVRDIPSPFVEWRSACAFSEVQYFALLSAGVKPQMARSVLPNSLKTELVMTANLREWRHFFDLRTADTAHPQLTQITRPLLKEFRDAIPVLFDDVGVVT